MYTFIFRSVKHKTHHFSSQKLNNSKSTLSRMRIRKNATRVVEGKKRSSSSYLICQLNQPPWDDDSFFSQGYWDNDLPLNGSSSSNASLHPASHSLVSEESMDLSFECVSEKENVGGGDDTPVMLLLMDKPEPAPLQMVLPTPATTVVLPKKRGRPRKSTSDASAGNNSNTSNCYNDDNPYEFYYYSGFGPSWSKRRGETKLITYSNSNNNVMDDDENKDNISKSGGNDNGHAIESFKSVIDAQRELDYIEDEEEEDEWYGGGRARKPIKARSLKSLM